MILSAAMLMNWLGERHGRDNFIAAARAMDRAVDRVLADPASRTADLGAAPAAPNLAAAWWRPFTTPPEPERDCHDPFPLHALAGRAS